MNAKSDLDAVVKIIENPKLFQVMIEKSLDKLRYGIRDSSFTTGLPEDINSDNTYDFLLEYYPAFALILDTDRLYHILHSVKHI